ncbi:MAG: DUF11 domain-containing protein, partial [Anaerolineae bacterium]|nr:DUF11 domain-containing protein [Anaerolineae bacterium]
LTEPPVLVRTDDTISFQWDLGSPDPAVNDDYFSVRWTGTITVPAGTYGFTMGSDDGSRLWIDDQLVMDHWDECCTYWQALVSLAEGPHDVEMEMHEHEGAAWAQLTWQHLLLNPASDENYSPSLTRDGDDNAVLTWQDNEWRIHYALFANDGAVLSQPAVYDTAHGSEFGLNYSGAGNGTLPGPDLRIQKTAAPDPVEAGDLLTYTLVVENLGNTQATGVTITDTLPADTAFARADEGGTLVGGEVRWTGKTVAAGQELTVTFAVTVTTPLTNGTLISNLAYGVESAEGATATGSPVTTVVESTPMLSVTKTAAPDPVEAGGLLTYTLVVANGGNAHATGVILTDTLPVSTTFVSATAGGALVGGEVRWTGQTVAAGATLAVHLVVRVDSSLAAGDTLANSDYGVRCTQVLTPVMGTPVTTGVVVTRWRTYLPIVLRQYP